MKQLLTFLSLFCFLIGLLSFADSRNETMPSGNHLIIVRPDSASFNKLISREGQRMYEIDSDFGFAINQTIDSIKSYNIPISTIHSGIIEFKDHENYKINCDSIIYGIILTSRRKLPIVDKSIYGFPYHLELINDYFSKP